MLYFRHKEFGALFSIEYVKGLIRCQGRQLNGSLNPKILVQKPITSKELDANGNITFDFNVKEYLVSEIPFSKDFEVIDLPDQSPIEFYPLPKKEEYKPYPMTLFKDIKIVKIK